MLGITLRDKIKNTQIKGRKKVRDIVEKAANMKWRWAYQLAKYDDKRWT